MKSLLRAKKLIHPLRLIQEDPAPVCDQIFTDYLIVEICVVSACYLLLAVTIIINRCKFSHVALVSTPSYPTSLRVKSVAQVFMIGLLVTSAALAFLDSSYWVKSCNNKFLGLLYLIPICVLALNIEWQKYQLERKIPLLWYQNQLVWGLISFCYLFAFIYCYIINSTDRYQSPDFIIVVLKTIDALFLAIYTIKKPQDLADYLADSGLKTRLIQKQNHLEAQKRRMRMSWDKDESEKDHILKRKTKNAGKASFENQIKKPALAVSVANKVQRRENPQTGGIEVLYKLHVVVGPCDYKILRTLHDFNNLEKAIITEFPENNAYSSAIDSLKAVLSDPEVENMSNVAFVVLNLQSFFAALLKPRKIPNSLIDFLEVPAEGRAELEQREIERMAADQANLEKNIGFFKLEENEEEDEEEDTEGQDCVGPSQRESLESKNSSEQDYCPHFVVSVPKYKKAAKGDHIEFMINLQLAEKMDEGWQIIKRYSDFVQLKQRLRDAVSVVPPKLPTKFLVGSEDEQLEDRRKGLESWLRVVLNEKLYFTPQLFEFINLSPAYYEWLQEEETFNFVNFKAIIDKNHILMNKSKPYTVYHIIIEERKDTDSKLKKKLYTIYRRYKEFHQLNEALKTRFSTAAVKLPELPPKYTAFSNKTTVDFRQQGLENYLNQLFNYPNIGDSFAFRKFISFRRTVDSFITGKDSTEQVIASSYHLEPQNISNLTMDKMLSTARNKKKF